MTESELQNLKSKTLKRINYLRVQLIHEAYLDGWTLNGFKREIVEKEFMLNLYNKLLRQINEKKINYDINSLFN